MTVKQYLHLYLNEKSNIPHWCHLIPREVAERAGPWNESLTLNDDGEYAARIIAASGGLAHAGSGPLYFYRKTPGSLSTVNSPDKVRSGISALDKIAVLASRNGVDMTQTKLFLKYYSLMTACYPSSKPYLMDLEDRINRFGGGKFSAILGGRAINFIAKIAGWKFARRLQLAKQKIFRLNAK